MLFLVRRTTDCFHFAKKEKDGTKKEKDGREKEKDGTKKEKDVRKKERKGASPV